MKLFLASALSAMSKQLTQYVWPLDWKKIACCLNPVDKRIEKEWAIPQWVLEDITMLENLWVELIPLDLRKWDSHIKQIVESVDWVFVCWWETQYLLQTARENDFPKLLNEFLHDPNHFYCSTSAWSCRIWSHIREYDEKEEVIDVVPWENRLPCMIIPHRSRDTPWSRNRYLWTAIEKVYNAGCATLCITDNQAIIFDWNTFTIINNS